MATYYFAGQLIGGVISVTLLSWLIEWALTSRYFDDPVQGKVASVIAAFAVGLTLYTLNGRDFITAVLAYGIPAILVGMWKYRSGVRQRDKSSQIDELEDTFR